VLLYGRAGCLTALFAGFPRGWLGEHFVDNASRVDAVPSASLLQACGADAAGAGRLEESDFSALDAAGFKFPEPFKAKAADGVTDIYGVMYKPYDFDPGRAYPVVAYVYPGPQTEAVMKSFAASACPGRRRRSQPPPPPLLLFPVFSCLFCAMVRKTTNEMYDGGRGGVKAPLLPTAGEPERAGAGAVRDGRGDPRQPRRTPAGHRCSAMTHTSHTGAV
jgi:hypothetical protein